MVEVLIELHHVLDLLYLLQNLSLDLLRRFDISWDLSDDLYCIEFVLVFSQVDSPKRSIV